MLYELQVRSGQVPDVLELEHDNARSALEALMTLLKHVRHARILRDGIVISEKELESDGESEEIQAVRDLEEDRLPATHQPGWGTDSDITKGQDGKPTTVRRPGNPDDNYE